MTNETDFNKYIPQTTLVQADHNGEIEMPAWVRPGKYRYTKLPDGSIRLDPVAVYAVAYDTKSGMVVDPMSKRRATIHARKYGGGYLVQLIDGEWVEQ